MNQMNLENFPDYDVVKKAVLKLRKEGFPKYDGISDIESFVKSIESILCKEFGVLFSFYIPLKHQDFNLKIFRARECDEIKNNSLIREHSYPPINYTKMGRCNFPGYPVFYCSDNPVTALLEVARNSGNWKNKFCISKWRIARNDEDFIFQNFLQTTLPTENHFNKLQESFRERINEPFEKSFKEGLNKEKKKGLLEYLAFLDKSFVEDDNYSLSATLAYRALYANHNYSADILMYPSVQTEFKGVNLALNPNFVENNLRMTRLYEVSLEEYDAKSGKTILTFFRYADVKKNIIWWNKIKPYDNTYEKILTEDFGNMMLNNSFETTTYKKIH